MNEPSKIKKSGHYRWVAVLLVFLCAGIMGASAQTNITTGFGPVQITLGTNNGPQDVDASVKVLAVLTLLTLAPSILRSRLRRA